MKKCLSHLVDWHIEEPEKEHVEFGDVLRKHGDEQAQYGAYHNIVLGNMFVWKLWKYKQADIGV